MPLRALPPARRRQDVVEHLQELVLSGEWQPGDQLPPERVLGEQLGVSRTIVREAARVLAERGFLEVAHGRGTFVRQPVLGDISERLRLLLRLEESAYWKATEARHVLETTIARLAADRRTDDDLARLDVALRRMEDALDDPPLVTDLLTPYARRWRIRCRGLGRCEIPPLRPAPALSGRDAPPVAGE